MILFKTFKIKYLFTLGMLFFVFQTYKIVEKSSVGRLYEDINAIPHQKVGLVLGTIKYLSNGNINLYYQNRIDATVQLFEHKKIDFILVSGDNSKMNYNEPIVIKKDLISRGIPENKIFLDYAGFRTFDSVVRSKEIFGQDSITIISQKFQNERAIYIAKKINQKTIGFNAKSVSKSYGFRTNLREYLARVKLMFDFKFKKKPKFLGKKIEIE